MTALPGDFDGDGRLDIAVWRPSTGGWWTIDSSTGQQHTTVWGRLGDVPVPADYDGDGRADIAIWRPSTGTWWIIDSATGNQHTHGLGQLGDVPVPGDWSGDGRADAAVWRPDAGQWWLPNSTVVWGQPGDVPVGSGCTAAFALGDGAIVRESSVPTVYGIFDGRKVLIPTSDALSVMGHTWESVRVVPDGSLASLAEARIPSLSPTPGSLVFPPPNDPDPPHFGRHFVIPGVTGSIRVVSQGREVAIVELRGWLHPVNPPSNVEEGWDDWHFTLEIDSAWAVGHNIDLNRVLKVGNILEYLSDASGPDAYRQITNPHIGIEVNGWKPGNDRGVARPDDWLVPGPIGDTLPGTRWPFDPRFPVGENARPYARVTGSLVADKEHPGGGVAAQRAWRAGMPNEAADALTRATEVHPPDLIEILPDRARRETLRGVAVVAGTGIFESAETELDARIAPMGPRPSPDHGIAVVELVGPETDLSTIVSGNEAGNGAFLQTSHYDVRLGVKVRRTGVGGRPGRFKAVYRVFWDIPGLPRPTGWWSQSGSLPLGAPDRIDYTITPNAVGSDAVEFVLTAGPGINWRKVLTIADGHGGRWDVVTQDQQACDRNGLFVAQLADGTLAFSKAGFLGAMTQITTLGDLDQLAPGSRVTFRWMSD